VSDSSWDSVGLPLLLDRRDDAARHFEAALRLNAAMGMLPWLERTRRAYSELGLGV
jgi:hypothetical protein